MTLEHAPRKSSLTAVDRVAHGLGLFSIGLGLAEMTFPGSVGRAVGLNGRESLLRSYGAREIASGLAALTPNAAPAIWARVAGDLLDIATLASAVGSDNLERRQKARTAMAVVVAVTVVDIVVATALTQQKARPRQWRTYSDRSGFPRGVQAARGVARDFQAPRDMRALPPALAPLNAGQ